MIEQSLQQLLGFSGWRLYLFWLILLIDRPQMESNQSNNLNQVPQRLLLRLIICFFLRVFFFSGISCLSSPSRPTNGLQQRFWKLPLAAAMIVQTDWLIIRGRLARWEKRSDLHWTASTKRGVISWARELIVLREMGSCFQSSIQFLKPRQKMYRNCSLRLEGTALHSSLVMRSHRGLLSSQEENPFASAMVNIVPPHKIWKKENYYSGSSLSILDREPQAPSQPNWNWQLPFSLSSWPIFASSLTTLRCSTRNSDSIWPSRGAQVAVSPSARSYKWFIFQQTSVEGEQRRRAFSGTMESAVRSQFESLAVEGEVSGAWRGWRDQAESCEILTNIVLVANIYLSF